jgi:acyl carrier protein
MTPAEILSELTGIFRDCFDDPAIAIEATTTARDIPAWDSAKMVMLILAVEERFNVRMRSRDIDALRCVGDWVRLIETHLAAR